MDEKRLALLKERLLRERERLQRELREIENRNLEQSQSEMSGENNYEDSFADTGTVTFERERDLSLERNTRDILNRVNRALEKMDKKTYGTCVSCGEPIDPARLKALPYAELCIGCKKKEEGIW